MSKNLLEKLNQAFEPEYKTEPAKIPESRAWDATDWQDFYNERAAVYEFDGKHTRQEAEQEAMRDCIDRWLPSSPDTHNNPDTCPQCGMDSGVTSAIPSTCYANPGGFILRIHDACMQAWCERRKTEAVAALAGVGITNNEEHL